MRIFAILFLGVSAASLPSTSHSQIQSVFPGHDDITLLSAGNVSQVSFAENTETGYLSPLPECESDTLPDCCCTSKNRWFAGAEAMFVRAVIERNAAFDTAVSGVRPDSVTYYDAQSELAPRLWVGVECANGLVAKVQYWHFENENTVPTPSLTANDLSGIYIPEMSTRFEVRGNEDGQFRQSLRLDCLDGELQHVVNSGCGRYVLSGGIRIASLVHEQRGDDYTNVRTIIVRRETDGIGPTVAVLGSWQALPNIQFETQLRGAILLAQPHASLSSPTNVNFAADREWEQILPIVEARIGAKWMLYECGGRRLRLIAAFEAQSWFDAVWEGGANDGRSDLGSIDRSTDLGFFGATVGLELSL